MSIRAVVLALAAALILLVVTRAPAADECSAGSSRARGLCPAGFTDSGGAGCFDVDECLTGNGGCDRLTTCTNSVGSRTCGACPAGYAGTGDAGCGDVDECAIGNGGCDAITTCRNTPGGRVCGACPPGYAGTGDTACNDVDECATNNGGCAIGLSECTNSPGSRSCTPCPPGYVGNGETCEDDSATAARATRPPGKPAARTSTTARRTRASTPAASTRG